jgi:hypothetical protein
MNKFFNFDTSEITPIHRAVHTEAKETFAKYELPESDKRDYIDEKLHVEIATLMYQLVDLPNAIDSETIVKGMLEGMNRNHRFLQREFWNVFMRFMLEYSKQEPRFFDGRNSHIPGMMKTMLESLYK